MARVQTDPEMLRLTMALEQAIENDLTDAANEITRMIEAYGNRLSASDTQELLEGVATVLTSFFVLMAANTRDTQVDIAQSQVQKELAKYARLLRRAGAPASYVQRFENTMLSYPGRVRRSFYTRPHPADMVTYQFRIKTVRESAQNTVRNIVRNGNRLGQNPNVIAKTVRGYLLPGHGGRRTEPLKEARMAARANKRYKPRNVRSGSVPYQAKRIARSESAESYRRAHTEMFENTILQGGEYDWLLSNSHAGYDDCDVLARRSPYKASERPHSHPNCMCTWSKRPPTLADVRELLRERGVIQ